MKELFLLLSLYSYHPIHSETGRFNSETVGIGVECMTSKDGGYALMAINDSKSNLAALIAKTWSSKYVGLSAGAMYRKIYFLDSTNRYYLFPYAMPNIRYKAVVLNIIPYIDTKLFKVLPSVTLTLRVKI